MMRYNRPRRQFFIFSLSPRHIDTALAPNHYNSTTRSTYHCNRVMWNRVPHFFTAISFSRICSSNAMHVTETNKQTQQSNTQCCWKSQKMRQCIKAEKPFAHVYRLPCPNTKQSRARTEQEKNKIRTLSSLAERIFVRMKQIFTPALGKCVFIYPCIRVVCFYLPLQQGGVDPGSAPTTYNRLGSQSSMVCEMVVPPGYIQFLPPIST